LELSQLRNLFKIALVNPGISQSVQRLVTDCTVQGSNVSAGEIFRTNPHWPWGPFSFMYNGKPALFLGNKEAGA
jgi:hypothetical protein